MNIKTIISSITVLFLAVTPLLSQIESGTSVKITIMGVPVEEKGKVDALYPVSGNGTVNLPFIGVMRAAGMQPETLAVAIQNAYKKAEIYTSPTIQVISTREGDGVREQLVHIGGQVRRPGPFQYNNNLTIYQAVQAAGGATEFGSLKRVQLYRNGKPQTCDLTDPKFMRLQLQPGDTIAVPQKNWLGQ